MKRVFRLAGAVLTSVLLVAVGFFFWASSAGLSEDKYIQTKRYSTALDTTAPDTLTVTTYNIGYLSGMTNNEPVVRSDSFLSANLEEALSLLEKTDSDLVGVQEIDYGAARSGYVHQLDTIAAELEYAAAAQAVNWDKRYIPFPYGRPAVHFGRTLSGQAVLSRFPIRQHTRTVLPRPPQWFGRDAFYLDRLAQVALIDIGGHPLAVMNLHLEAFDMTTREEQARNVNALYDRLVKAGLPVLVLGDVNSVLPASRSHLPSTKRQGVTDDKTIPLLLADTDLRPVYADSTYASDPPPATYPADAPTRKIDHIFYSPDVMRPVDRQIRCGAPSPPSDHCAVTASFILLGAAKPRSASTDVPSLDSLLTE